ncbi:MAG: DEAD/DEAH box helicase [Gemmiger sp.]|uniref:DEAD/DEAH box helicase n=1 Tax=Gemmiger sp. TaxID=2049027 RepID=UPI002E75CE44|nr:DEAD/DEAH box helicase [Gemmiger sp.]MEE0097869.1 DEAD/DEAH box helicase [Gemmiger sp.]
MKIALIRGVVTIAELSNLDFQRLKNIGGLRWNRTTRCMVGPVSLNLLDGLARYYKLPADMETKRQRLGKTRREIDAERLAEDPAPLLPYPVKANLYKHQIRGANMALRAFGALDAKTPGGGFGELFEMGCGKTLTTIAVAGALYNLGKIDRVLVVAPTSVCSVWPHDLNQFATFPWEARVLLGDKKKRLKALNELENWPFKALRIAVINYESTHRDGIFEALAAYKPDLIVCDESQRIKNPSAAQSKALHKLGDAAPFRMILSGTPVQNNAVDLYSQYRFLDPAVYGANFYAFKNRYCIMGGYGQHQIVGYRNMDELVEKEHSVAYRVTKEECLDLPQQTFINRYVQFTDAEQAIYEQLRKSSFLELETGENVTATTILTMYLRLMQLTGGFLTADESTRPKQVNTAKLDALADIVDDYVVDAGKKLVIFARFRAEIAAIENLLRLRKIQCGSIYGDVPMEERGKIVEDFQTNPDTKVFVAQIQTAGLGITLHAASTAVFYSYDYNYANYAQALARIHRIGQRLPVTYIHLVVDGSIDEKILAALENKEDMAKTVVDSWREVLTAPEKRRNP